MLTAWAQFPISSWLSSLDARHTAVKRKARVQFPPKLSLKNVLNFRKFSLSRRKIKLCTSHMDQGIYY